MTGCLRADHRRWIVVVQRHEIDGRADSQRGSRHLGEEKKLTTMEMGATDCDIEILRTVIASAGCIAMIPAVQNITVEAREEAPAGAVAREEIGTGAEGGGVEVDREARKGPNG